MRTLNQLLTRVFGARGGGLAMLQTVLAQGGIVAVNVVTGVITARLLGPTGRGEFAAASMWFLLPSQLATVGLQSAIIYRTRLDPAHSASVSGAGLMIGLGLFVPSAVLCGVLLPGLLHAYSAAIVALAQVAVLAAFLNVWMLLARQSLLGMRNVHLFNLSCAGSSVAYLLALLLALPWTRRPRCIASSPRRPQCWRRPCGGRRGVGAGARCGPSPSSARSHGIAGRQPGLISSRCSTGTSTGWSLWA